MPKKRLVFTLLYQKKSFWLSRNFRLQRVGDINWLQENYQFSRVAKCIDELFILDVSRDNPDVKNFAHTVGEIAQGCFMPITLGGRINDTKVADYYIKNGADKLILNTAIVKNPELVKELVQTYGSQCIIASVDIKVKDGLVTAYVDNGQTPVNFSFDEYLVYLLSLNIGELCLNSIDRDGTGQGFDQDVLLRYFTNFPIPLILAGGVGNQSHLLDGIKINGVDAVSTSNLFNFMGEGLPNARQYLLDNYIDLAKW